MTGGPSAGPASAYPTLSKPALICFNGPNEVCALRLITGRIAGFTAPVSALADPVKARCVAAIVRAAVPKNRRRCWSMASPLLMSLMADLHGAALALVR